MKAPVVLMPQCCAA